MNERIQKLYNQAFVPHTTICPDNNMPYETVLFSTEKFAELLIQECAQVFEAEVDTWKEMDPYQGSMKRKGTQAIKQHFGVE